MSDNIPPATAAERAAAEAERASVAAPEPSEPASRPDTDEVARLRALLKHSLDELTALRAMLD